MAKIHMRQMRTHLDCMLVSGCQTMWERRFGLLRFRSRVSSLFAFFIFTRHSHSPLDTHAHREQRGVASPFATPCSSE